MARGTKMKTNIKAPNIKISEGIRNYINAKTKTFERPITKFLAESDDVDKNPIEVRKRRVEAFWEIGTQSSGVKKGLFYCKVQIAIPGKDKYVKAETASGDLYEAIDKIKDIITAQIVELKDKPADVKKRAARKVKRDIGFDPTSKIRDKESRARDESL
jgi:ribosomal subunit interface protein